jgi:AraC-like DNA-binding protein
MTVHGQAHESSSRGVVSTRSGPRLACGTRSRKLQTRLSLCRSRTWHNNWDIDGFIRCAIDTRNSAKKFKRSRAISAVPCGERYTHPTPEMAREAMERAIQDSPRSLMAVCKQIGYRNLSSLYHRFPELCRALVAKNRSRREQKDQWVRDLITKALDEEPMPTLKELARRLGSHPHELRRRFPELCAALVARLPERKRLERERIRKQLEDALEQNPAPAMKVVARSLGGNQQHLRVIFPDLYGKIKRRFVEHQKTVRAERPVQFLAQVRKAVINLCEWGIHPS